MDVITSLADVLILVISAMRIITFDEFWKIFRKGKEIALGSRPAVATW
jgi:hypothetical protein